MAFFTWSEQMSVNNAQMDAQHQKLVGLINQLYDAMRQGMGKDVTGKIINELYNYTITHFRAEERLMSEKNFPKLAEQEASHEKFTAKVNQFKQDFDDGKLSLSMDIMNFLQDWLKNHIMKMDKEYAEVMV